MFEQLKLEGDCFFENVKFDMKGTSLILRVENKIGHINIRNATIQLMPKDEQSKEFLIEIIREYCRNVGRNIAGSISSFHVPFQLKLYK